MIVTTPTETSTPIGTTVNQYGLLTGATVYASVRDTRNGVWLDFIDDNWRGSPSTKELTLSETDSGRYEGTVDLTLRNAGAVTFQVYYRVNVGGQDVGSQEGLFIESAVDLASLEAHGDATWSTATGFSTHSETDAAAAVWDKTGVDHLTAGSMGYLQDQAASGGAGLTEPQVQNAIWSAPTASHVTPDTFGAAVAASAELPDELVDIVNLYFQTVRRYGPIAVAQPLPTRDEIFAGNVGVKLQLPIILDGDFANLADVVDVQFDFTAPDGTEIQKPGAAANTLTGSMVTLTTDSSVFYSAGRWWVQATATWPDPVIKSSPAFAIDVQGPLPVP